MKAWSKFILLIIFLIISSYIFLESPFSRKLEPSSPQKTIINPVLTAATSGAEILSQVGICHIKGNLPDSSCTPGAMDPKVTQDNIDQTICVSGYTKTVRPPVSYTNSLK